MKCLVAVIGPTGIGKTKLALYLAKNFGGEIINGDSRQVYRFMDIGTAKPTILDRALVPHHIIDIVDPAEHFSLALYKNLATEAIDNIQQRGKLPLLVGGSGQYIWSTIEGWILPEVPPDMEFRKQAENVADKKGIENLFQELKKIDPVAATAIMPTNLRRIIRALEIYQSTGQRASQLWQKKPLSFPIAIIGLTTSRGALYNNIDLRVDEMIKLGMVDEVKGLIQRGYGLDLPSMSGIGYGQIGMYLNGKSSLSEAIQLMKYKTHQFVRRQYTWFSLDDSRIRWFNICDNIQDKVTNVIRDFLNNAVKEEYGN
jgi:tRNA dimethylallyltransferase